MKIYITFLYFYKTIKFIDYYVLHQSNLHVIGNIIFELFFNIKIQYFFIMTSS